MVDAIDVLGVAASECDECEGAGTVTFCHGPYERTRECHACYGAGRRTPCPGCTDGTSPNTGETCWTCEGFAVLS
ncbi:RecJ-like exonuclease [Streptomyces griseochromogenes]|uniref:RecJ-like exonuclease n=1 Tax=Streptomyces griseochromogenes TaxID=68214 RepID=A0ABS4M6R9_9ACTN|nr:RecJ-like exonuclease [Streptomyces griseochromogenes]